MISSPILFDESEWVPDPHDSPRHVPPGMSYDLTQGERRRIRNECRERALAIVGEDQSLSMAESLRLGAPQSVRPRLGQATFRTAVSPAYAQPARSPENTPSNGILLRADLHRIFDACYVTVDRSLRLIVGRRLKEEFDNGRSYYHLNGQPIFVPRPVADKPDLQLLARHNEAVSLG